MVIVAAVTNFHFPPAKATPAAAAAEGQNGTAADRAPRVPPRDDERLLLYYRRRPRVAYVYGFLPRTAPNRLKAFSFVRGYTVRAVHLHYDNITRGTACISYTYTHTLELGNYNNIL